MFADSKTRLEAYVAQIFAMVGAAGGAVNALAGGANITLNMNDYGMKALAGNGAVESYGDELMAGFLNALRSMGVK
jgi:hypothetical protein